MRIFTSTWFEPLPGTIQKIGISRSTPRRYKRGYRVMRELAPGGWFNSVTLAEHHQLYMAQLAQLDARAVVEKIAKFGAGRDVALLCFEKPGDPAAWCHRGQLSAHIQDALRIEVYEFGMEDQGCGWRHPKLLPEFKK
jgi:hypothetical protein